MRCPNCGKDDFYTTEVTDREEFVHYDWNGYAVYKTVWASYYEHTCCDCGTYWRTDWQTWTTEGGW